jgi:hypothetical protein
MLMDINCELIDLCSLRVQTFGESQTYPWSTGWSSQVGFFAVDLNTRKLADMPYNIGCTLLKWVYTDQLDTKLGDSYILDLMRAGGRFRLESLLHRFERFSLEKLVQNADWLLNLQM